MLVAELAAGTALDREFAARLAASLTKRRVGKSPRPRRRRQLPSSTASILRDGLHPFPLCRPPKPAPNMFRPASRAVVRAACSSPRALHRAPAARRLVSTAPPTQKSRSWKSSLARWGLAGAAVYYYNTSNAFAEEPTCKHLRAARPRS